MKFFAVTANCGNDTLGNKATEKLIKEVKGKSPDFVVINCQEVDFEAARKQLVEELGEGSDYTVSLAGKMPTHTKLDAQFHQNTGLACFVIHRKSLAIDVKSSVMARRNQFRGGTGYNKGGLIVDFRIGDTSIQSISGHLDSSKAAKRNLDWAKINKAMSRDSVSDWQELVQAIPMIRMAGYDANTRNLLGKSNIWESGAHEIIALKQAPLGERHYSKDSTFKTSKVNFVDVKDKKRPGYVGGGMLDFVDIAMGGSEHSGWQVERVGEIPEFRCDDPSTERDHDVIMSPMQEYIRQDEFDRVKQYMINQLSACAPKLIEEIRQADQIKLIKIYNKWLSKDGLLNRQIELQADLLRWTRKAGKIDSDIANDIKSALLKDEPWFSTTDNSRKKQHFQRQLVLALMRCKTKQDLELVRDAIQNPNQFSVQATSLLKRSVMIDLKIWVEKLVKQFKTVLLYSFDPKKNPQDTIARFANASAALEDRLKWVQQEADSQEKTIVCEVLAELISAFSKATDAIRSTSSVTEEKHIVDDFNQTVKTQLARWPSNFNPVSQEVVRESVKSVSARYKKLMDERRDAGPENGPVAGIKSEK